MIEAARRGVLVAGLVAAPIAVGCDGPDDTDDDVGRIAAIRSAEAVAAKSNLALLAEKFAGARELADMTVDEARAAAVMLLEDRLRNLSLVACERELMSDPVLGTVDAAVVACQLGVLQIDGEMHAQVEIETAPCGAGQCPSAVVWTLDDFDLQIGTPGFRPRLRGTVVLRDPVDPALPMSWSTGADFVLDNRLGSFATRSTASWYVADDRCVEGLQLEARLDRLDDAIDDPDADLEPELGQIVVSATGVDRCPAKCATAGTVQLAFGRGRVLQWDFAGQQLDVLVPGGHHFTAMLVCDE